MRRLKTYAPLIGMALVVFGIGLFTYHLSSFAHWRTFPRNARYGMSAGAMLAVAGAFLVRSKET